MPIDIDPEIAEDLKKAGAQLLGSVLRIGARAGRAAASRVLDDLGDLAEDAGKRVRRAAKSVRDPFPSWPDDE